MNEDVYTMCTCNSIALRLLYRCYFRAHSSAGEHYLHTVGVSSSILLAPNKVNPFAKRICIEPPVSLKPVYVLSFEYTEATWYQFSEVSMIKNPDYFTLTVRQNSGKKTYYYYCYDKNNKRIKRSTGMHSRAAALQVIQERIASGTLISDFRSGFVDKSILFSEYTEFFYISGKCPICKERELRGKPYTQCVIEGNRKRLDMHILPYLGKMKVSSITPAVLKDWQYTLKEAGLSSSSVNRVRSTLSPIFERAVDDGVLTYNPLKRVKQLYVSPETSRGAFTIDEIQKLFSLEWDSPLAKLACLLSSFTGMRMGEVRALKAGAIRNGYIIVSLALDGNSNEKSTKSGRIRYCPIPEQLEKELLKYARKSDDWIFTLNGIKPVGAKYILNNLKKEMDRIGINHNAENLTFHSFRHFFNSQLVAAGVQGELVRAVIGHESERMTERYLHLSPDQMNVVRNVQEGLRTLL